jgi:hypothetical protein
MNKKLKRELAEYEALVAEVKGDCDKCSYDCKQRLQWMDSIIEELRQEREALAQERHKLRAEREQLHGLYKINLRVLNIVNAPAETKGPQDDNEQEKTLPDWH